MRIAVIGDLHLGYRQYGLIEREEDFYKRWYDTCSQIINHHEQPDIVIQLGDIFDSHMPSARAMYEYQKGVSMFLTNDIHYLSITGNHTIIKKKDFMSPDDFFTKMLDLTSLDDNYKIYDNVFIGGVKYRSASNKDELMEEINKIANAAQTYDNTVKILLLHQAVDVDLLYGAELEEQDLPVDVFDYIFIGHLHSKILRKHGKCNIVYPGSIERSSTTEAKDEIKQGKGYILLDTDKKEVFDVRVPFDRRFVFVDVEDEDDIINVKEYIQSFTLKPIVNLKFSQVNVDRAHEIGNLIADDCLKLNIEVVNDDLDDEDTELLTEDSISSIEEMLEKRLTKNQAVFAYDLIQIFNKKDKVSENIASAVELSDEYFEKNY